MPPTWTSFVVLSVCLGFFADFPVGRAKLEDGMNAIHPIGAALLPYIAFAGAISGGVQIVLWVVRTGIDLLNDGPSMRKFKALASAIRDCKVDLITYLEITYLSSEVFAKTDRETRLTVEVKLLMDQLEALKIPVPDFRTIGNQEQWKFLVAYLASMETLASSGNLKHARQSQFGEQVKQPTSDM